MQPGTRIGSYRVTAIDPSGGLQARHMPSGELVRIELADEGDWATATAYARAAEILENLDHPGVLRVLDRGVLPDDRAWIATEMAAGTPLSERIRRRRLAIHETAALIRDVAEVLRVAHDDGIVHGRLRPEDIVLSDPGAPFPVRIGGWSRARRPTAWRAVEQLTPYSAPELECCRIDYASDVYSLGAIAYRAITGVHMSPTGPHRGLTGSLSSTIARMVDHDRTRRPSASDAAERARELVGDRTFTAAHLPRPRWTPPPGELRAAAARSLLDLEDHHGDDRDHD